MDALLRRSEISAAPAFPEARTELRWREAELWVARRPYPVDVPCPVCGAYSPCDFFGRQRCPQGHEFGQRAFWSGNAASCCLLLEDVRDGRTLIYPEVPLQWHDDARVIAGAAADQAPGF